MKKTLLSLLLALTFVMAFASMAAAAPSTYNSSIQIQNLDEDAQANIVITFYDSAGNPQTYSDTVPAGGSNTYFPLPAVAAGFDGSAVVSADKPVAAIVNVVADGFLFGASYGGFSEGANTVSLPLIMKNNGGFNTWFNVQNAGTADATVKVRYANTSCTETATVKPGAAKRFDQTGNACLGTRYVGAATVIVDNNNDNSADADGRIVASVMEVGATTLFAYNGFVGGGSTNVIIPLVNSNNAGYVTGLQIQNIGAANTNVTVAYTPAAGANNGSACTETKSIAPGASKTFAFYAFQSATDPEPGTNNCADGARFVGSAIISSNSGNQPLVAIVNQLNLAAAKGSAYNAFNPASATRTVVMPLIMDRNSGFFTGMSVVNIGSATTVTCTYVRSSNNQTVRTETTSSIATNGAFGVIHNNYLADRFVGSATCVANAAGGLLIGQVNELGSGAGDQLFTYEAVNK